MPSLFAPIEAVVFDMDGLILDSEPVYRAASQAAAASFGFELTDTMYLALVGSNRKESERILHDLMGETFPIEEFNAAWPKFWSAHVEENGVIAKPGIEELLEHVRERGWPFAIATASDAPRARICLQAAGMSGHFDVIVTGDSVARSKPAPDIYLRAATLLGADARASVAFEDSVPGAQAGLAAGMAVMLVPDLVQPDAAMRERVHAVLDSLHDAPAALASLETLAAR